MFNWALYQEGLRRVRTLAILLLMVMVLGAVIQPVSALAQHASGLRFGWLGMDEVIRVDGFDELVMMSFALFVGAPVLTLSLFSFLNKRNSSDVYHAIPHKRETLFISLIASILTWVVLGMWLSTAISVTIYATSAYTVIHGDFIFGILLGMSAACLLVISAITLAMTVTGTWLSNVIASLLILFLPRLLIDAFLLLVVERTRVVTHADFGWLSEGSRNILIGFLTGGAGQNNGSFDQMIMRGAPYTFVLAVVYLVIAALLFKRRPSELAGYSGSRWTQLFIRIAVTFTITLPAIGLMVMHEELDSERFFVILGIYLIALVGSFAYEWVTTKKIPHFAQMLPGLVVVVLFNLGFILGVSTSSNVILQEIATEQISSVTIVDLSPDFWESSYAEIQARGFEITDEHVVQLLGETFNENMSALRINDVQYGWGGRRIRVTFHVEDGRSLTRSIHVTRQLQLQEWMIKNEAYRMLWLAIPENPDRVSTWDHDLTSEALHHVLDVLRVELQEVDFARWYNLVGSFGVRGYDEGYDAKELVHPSPMVTIGEILVQGTVEGSPYDSRFPITALTPRTLALYQSYARAGVVRGE